METRSRYILIGSFMLVAIVAIFAFVYWLENAGGLTERAEYKIRFDTPVSGLYPGSPVLYNGVRAGEVAGLRLNPEKPKMVTVSISVDKSMPIREDTSVGVAVLGLTGSSAITLTGGSDDSPKLTSKDGQVPVLIAPPDAGLDWMQSAQKVLKNTNTILTENREGLHTTITNMETFTDTLAKNSDNVQGLIDGLSGFLGTDEEGGEKTKVFGLQAVDDFPSGPEKKPGWQMLVSDPNAQLSLTSEDIAAVAKDGERSVLGQAKWSDSVPSLVNQAMVESFENAGYLDSVSRSPDLVADYTLQTDIHQFAVATGGKEPTASIDMVVRILNQEGKIVGARQFKRSGPIKEANAAEAAPVFDKEFAGILEELVPWAIETISSAPKPADDTGMDGGDQGFPPAP